MKIQINQREYQIYKLLLVHVTGLIPKAISSKTGICVSSTYNYLYSLDKLNLVKLVKGNQYRLVNPWNQDIKPSKYSSDNYEVTI